MVFSNSLIKNAYARKGKKTNWTSSLRESSSSVAGGLWKIVKETPIEIALLASLGLSGGLFYGIKHESQRERKIPLAFSEYSQIVKDSEKKDKSVGAITSFYALDNDSRMKIFEAWNNSWKVTGGNQKREFAKELKRITDPEIKEFHYNLADLLSMMPRASDDALSKLQSFRLVLSGTQDLNSNLEDAWDDSHNDHYHTEFYTDTETYRDSQGNTRTRTVTRTRQVYDYTTHSYTFNYERGRMAGNVLGEMNGKLSRFEWLEILTMASRVNTQNEQAIKDSREQKEKENEYSKSEMREIAMTWNSSSVYNANQSTIVNSYNFISGQSLGYLDSLRTAHSDSYTTFSRSDSGPAEFQINERILGYGRKLESGLAEVLNGVYGSREDSLKLQKLIPEYIDASLYSGLEDESKKGTNPRKLQNEIMQIAREGYQRNFPKGLDVEGARAWYVALMTFGGLFVGGIAGLGLDRGINVLTERKYQLISNIS